MVMRLLVISALYTRTLRICQSPGVKGGQSDRLETSRPSFPSSGTTRGRLVGGGDIPTQRQQRREVDLLSNSASTAAFSGVGN